MPIGGYEDHYRAKRVKRDFLQWTNSAVDDLFGLKTWCALFNFILLNNKLE